jgi:RNA polymerase sigma factor (sigma-70 family)
MGDAIEDELRAQAPRVLATLIRRHGQFDRCEDAVQEALIEAHRTWRHVPERPFGWLLTVAERRLVDERRRDAARARREERVAREAPVALVADRREDQPGGDGDDELALLLLCCHPDLTPASQIALTLRAVGGLTTTQVARALLSSEQTIAQRIARAKARLRGVPFGSPPALEPSARLDAALHVAYLIFTEGHAASVGPELQRDDLAAEAIRLTRRVHAALPDDPRVQGLLALMLLTHARRATRVSADGELVPLAEQDRSRWDRAMIAEGVALVEVALKTGPLEPYPLQAAIAAVHAEARDADATDWPQILALFDLLRHFGHNPVVELNRAVAVGEVHGGRQGLANLDALQHDPRIAADHRLDAVRGHLLAKAGEHAAAAQAYARAARRAPALPERRYLARRASELGYDATEGSAPPRSSRTSGARPATR